MRFLNNLQEITQQYQYFIFDIWGVLHDGTEAYPNVLPTLQALKENGKNVCLLSNAPRRAFKAQEMLESFNITDDLYDFILTSGEATYTYLKHNQENGFKKFNDKYLYIGPQKDIDILDGLQYRITKNENEASFSIVTGYDHPNSLIDEKIEDLRKSISQKLPLICVNPDMIVVKKSGKSQLCAGQIAKQYKEIGGEVIYFGKPYRNVYNEIFKLYNLSQTDKDKVVAIGDGLETDIEGANKHGISSIFVTGGIISATLGNKYNELPDIDALKKQFELHNSYPKYVITNL